MPFMLVRIAAASKPDITLETIFPACQIAIRKGLSFFIYHEDVVRDTAGVNGPSKNPTRKRQKMKLQGLVRAVIDIVTADQQSMHTRSRTRAFPRARITLPGTREIKWPT
jgi:hypothetical protein